MSNLFIRRRHVESRLLAKMNVIQATASLLLLAGCLALPTPGQRQETPLRLARSELVPISQSNVRIINGGDANPLQFPWQAALLTTTNVFFCGGSIIGLEWILTAGHCLDPFTEFNVAVGGLKLPDKSDEKSRQTFTTKNRFLHPQYDMTFLDNDIGLLKLPRELKTSLIVKPIALPPYSMATTDLTGMTASISGWGRTNDESLPSPVLKYTFLKVLPNSVCEIEYGNTMIGNKLCLSADDGNSVCQGDSGGALVIREEGRERNLIQIGITSFVSTEGCTVKMPQGFTRVTSFLEFIEDITGIPIED